MQADGHISMSIYVIKLDIDFFQSMIYGLL